MLESDRKGNNLTSLEREAHSWIRRLASGEASAADAVALQRWCDQSPRHAAAFSEASQFWQAFGTAGECLRHEGSLRQRTRRDGRALIGRRAALGGALAASVAAAAIVRPPLGLWPSFAELRADYRTAPGEQRHIAVADGVQVQMNTRTSISAQHEGGSATVGLIAGEASFTVSERAARPFNVVAADGRISAFGAHFEVRVTGAAACVTCFANDVRVRYSGQDLVLQARQQVTYGSDKIGSVVTVDPAVVAAWQKGLIIFTMTPLADVVEELNRYRSGRVVLLNSELAHIPVNGRFRVDQPDEALAQIERAFGVHRRNLPGGLVLLT